MPALNGQLNATVVINAPNPFSGTYNWSGGSNTYYLSNQAGEPVYNAPIHFTYIGVDNAFFTLFHVSHPVSNTANGALRVQIFQQDNRWHFNGDNSQEISGSNRALWNTWTNTQNAGQTNLDWCKDAAQQFMNAVQAGVANAVLGAILS
jgi:hypothetical protein